MNSLRDDTQQLTEQLKDILRFQDDDEKFEFEMQMIHLNLMNQVRELMEKQGMNKKMLAECLHTSKGYVSQLFSGDKMFNLPLIAKLQRIFHVQFMASFQEIAQYSSGIVNKENDQNVYQFDLYKNGHFKRTGEKHYRLNHVRSSEQKVA